MPDLTLKEIEAKIGLQPFTNLHSSIITLEVRLSQNINLRPLLHLWLQKQGLPVKTIELASVTAIAKAYSIKNYLLGWRRNVNPTYDLIVEDDEVGEAGEEGANSSETPLQSTPSISEKWLSDLYKQITLTTNKIIEERLNKTTLKLDDSAKEQIKILAKTTAKTTIEELIPPREIEIVDKTRGTVVSLGLQHNKFPTLLRACQARDHRDFRLNIWLTGPTGSGKTTAAEAVSKALSLPFGSDGSLDADYKVLGFRDANGHIISTQFLDIYQNGGIYVADEIDNWAPSALLSLNSALANGFCASPSGLINRHKDCCVIACANTWGLGATSDYVGRARLDAASLDRFQPKIDWPIDEGLEGAIADKMAGSLGRDWHCLVIETRRKAHTQGLKIIISPRATFNGLSLLLSGFTWKETVSMTIGAGISKDQFNAIGLNRPFDRDNEDNTSTYQRAAQ